MRLCVAFLLVLLFLSCVPVQAEINPSVDTKPFFCRYTLTDWTPLCPTVGTGGIGSGSTFVNSDNNTFYYNTTTNESYIISNQTSFFNTTIGNNLTTFSNYTYWYITNITQSEMNQTPGPQGPQGTQGVPGPEGPMNRTPNMTAGPPGSMNMTPNMTAGPQGIQGEQGPQGIQGIQGIQGVNGTPGAPGEKGEKGDKGDTGATGATGPMNMTPNMTAGPPGADGATGATGPAGLDANVSSMYPVTSVYGTTNASANPSTLLGAGTWSPAYNLSGVTTYNSTAFHPTMTTNTAPSPYIVSASSEYNAGLAGFKAFDNSGTSKWASTATSPPHWISLYDSKAWVVGNYSITGGYDTTAGDPTAWKLNASTDGTTWTTLDTRSGVSWSGNSQVQFFTFTNSNAYNYYCWTISADVGSSYASATQFNLYNTLSQSKNIYFWERTA